MFGESALKGEPVKIGAAALYRLRQEPTALARRQGLPGRPRSLGEQPQPRYANRSWITGDEIYLARVTPSIEAINDGTKYEFFAGHDTSGHEAWSRKLSDARPTAAWNNNMGCVTITYLGPLKKYFMCVTDGGNTVSRYSTYLLEAESLGGPWKLVTYMKDFGVQAYFVNIPASSSSPLAQLSGCAIPPTSPAAG